MKFAVIWPTNSCGCVTKAKGQWYIPPPKATFYLNMKGHTMFIPPKPNDVDVLVDWLKSLLK